MKKTVFVILICLLLAFIINSDEISDVLKNNIGKLVNVYLIQYYPSTPIYSSMPINCIRGIIVSADDKVLVISVIKNDSVSNPSGPDVPGKMYIRISEIAAIKIADK